MDTWSIRKKQSQTKPNKAKTNPIFANKTPIRTQFKPNLSCRSLWRSRKKTNFTFSQRLIKAARCQVSVLGPPPMDKCGLTDIIGRRISVDFVRLYQESCSELPSILTYNYLPFTDFPLCSFVRNRSGPYAKIGRFCLHSGVITRQQSTIARCRYFQRYRPACDYCKGHRKNIPGPPHDTAYARRQDNICGLVYRPRRSRRPNGPQRRWWPELDAHG